LKIQNGRLAFAPKEKGLQDNKQGGGHRTFESSTRKNPFYFIRTGLCRHCGESSRKYNKLVDHLAVASRDPEVTIKELNESMPFQSRIFDVQQVTSSAVCGTIRHTTPLLVFILLFGFVS